MTSPFKISPTGSLCTKQPAGAVDIESTTKRRQQVICRHSGRQHHFICFQNAVIGHHTNHTTAIFNQSLCPHTLQYISAQARAACSSFSTACTGSTRLLLHQRPLLTARVLVAVLGAQPAGIDQRNIITPADCCFTKAGALAPADPTTSRRTSPHQVQQCLCPGAAKATSNGGAD